VTRKGCGQDFNMRCPKCGSRLIVRDLPFMDDMTTVICADHKKALEKTRPLLSTALYGEGAAERHAAQERYRTILKAHCDFAAYQWQSGFDEIFRSAFQQGVDIAPQPIDGAWGDMV